MVDSINRIAVFCGSNLGNSPVYADAARSLAETLSKQNISLVYGGARVGLMGILADTMLSLGQSVLGVIPEQLQQVEIAHHGLTELIITKDMHERKALINEKADGFILLPGGPGSLDEFFEVLTWLQLGYHQKPCAILNVAGYYEKMIHFIQHICSEGFMKMAHHNAIICDQSPECLLSKMCAYKGGSIERKWIGHADCIEEPVS